MLEHSISNSKVEAALPTDANGLSISEISELESGTMDVQLKANETRGMLLIIRCKIVCLPVCCPKI